MSEAQTDLIGKYGDNVAIAANIYLAMEGGEAGEAGEAADEAKKLEGVAADVEQAAGEEKNTDWSKVFTPDVVGQILEGQKAVAKAQGELLTAAQDFSDTAMKATQAEATTYDGLQPYLTKLKSLLSDLGGLQGDLKISAKRQSVQTGDDPKKPDGPEKPEGGEQDADKDKPKPKPPKTVATANALPAASDMPKPTSKNSDASARFMEVTIYFSKEDMSQSSSLQSSASQTSWDVDMFFGSASGSSDSSESSSRQDMMDSSTSIEIGFKVMKVDIARGWFNPGLFGLTKDFVKVTEDVISQGPPESRETTDLDSLNDAVLPCFPTSFVVAKDVSIRFKASESSLHAAKSAADKHSSVGGGFLCFSAASSSSSHSNSQSVTTHSESNTVTIRLTAPQILGWFLEFLPKDVAAPVGENNFSIVDYLKEIHLPGEPPSKDAGEENV